LMRNRVVVTGLGIVAPNGIGKNEFLCALKEGTSGIRYLPELKALNFSCQVGGIPPGFAELKEKYFPPEELDSINDNVGYAALAAMDAWEDAGLALPAASEEVDWDTGAVIGCGIGGMTVIAETLIPLVNAGKVRRLGSRVVEQVMASAASARVAGLLGLGNQVTANSSACSTGNEAIFEGMMRIRLGLAKRVLAGGSEGSSPYIWAGFDAMRVLARRYNDRPQAASRPMSAGADGFVPGSGAAILMLEELTCALARGARIYAEIRGGYINCGGHRQGGSMTAPNPYGVRRCIQGALADAAVSPEEIDAISGHLTATFADPAEVLNWAAALNRGPGDFPYINSTKSLIGHCLGAAGALESAACVLELWQGFFHPSLNCEDLHPEIAAFAASIPQRTISPAKLDLIAKAGFGFGDVNSCLIFKKWREPLT
jgi:3-oxoacyl-(acyl-carrier-protein) synthase